MLPYLVKSQILGIMNLIFNATTATSLFSSLYTATMSTANKSSTGSTPPSTAASIIADLSDDRPRVSELIKFYELSIKGQLEAYLPTEAIRKIRIAVNDREGMSLLMRAIEEDPTLLHKLREATGKTNEHCSSKYTFSSNDNYISLCMLHRSTITRTASSNSTTKTIIVTKLNTN